MLTLEVYDSEQQVIWEIWLQVAHNFGVLGAKLH